MIPNLQLPRHLAHRLQNDPVHTISRVNHGQTQLAPVTLLLVLCLLFFNKNSVTKRKQALQKVVQGGVASDHGWIVILSRPGHSGEDEPRVEAIGSREPWTAHSHWQHPAIFWHFCGNFRMSRGSLQKLQRRNRHEKRPKIVFCTRSKKGSENRSSRFEPKIS